MNIARKLAPIGVALLSIVTITAGASIPVSATPLTDTLRKTLAVKETAALNVTAMVSCREHTIMVEVKNNLSVAVTPDVTFDNQEPDYPNKLPIEPGEKGMYLFSYTGNNLYATVQVKSEEQKTITVPTWVNCLEPVSFAAERTSASAVSGMLTNNSTLVGQTVYLQVGYGSVQVESLAPGESRFIALPFKAMDGQEFVSLTVANHGGYESRYNIDLEKPESPLPKE